MCVIYRKQRISDTHTEFMGSDITVLGRSKKTDTHLYGESGWAGWSKEGGVSSHGPFLSHLGNGEV